MRRVTVACASTNTVPMDWDRNTGLILKEMRRAHALGVGVLLFPEMCIPGYGCEDMFHAPFVWAESWNQLQRIKHETADGCWGMLVSVGLPVRHRGALFNCAALLLNGEILGLVAKRHMAGDGIHYEPRWFKPWPRDTVGYVDPPDLAGHPYRESDRIPIGDIHFDVNGIRLGYEICEDAWVAERPGAELSKLGCDIILNPSASHFAFGKNATRRRWSEEGSRAFGVTYMLANLIGNEAGRAIYDGGNLICSGGRTVAQGRRFTFRDTQLVAQTLDLDLNRTSQARIHSFNPDLSPEDGRCVKARTEVFNFKPVVPDSFEGCVTTDLITWDAEPTDMGKEEEFTRAVALALHDYCRKSRSNGFVVSLSGGADSAAVAVLCDLSLILAREELGIPEVVTRLGYKGDLSMEYMRAWNLFCAYQPTANSGDVTRHAAEEVAAACGATWRILDIEPMVQGYIAEAEKALGRKLTWEQDDIVLQNIQARVRGPMIWMFANLRNALLLATSNRSEAAVGYATMDGDTCGGVSPIAGIDKAFLRQWLLWMQNHGIQGIQYPALQYITNQAPTAELRPEEMEQTDEGDLMPYPLLDHIERLAIFDKKAPGEILCTLIEEGVYEELQLREWVTKFFQLWTRNQWKRERYAPSFHVDDENLDPRSWCRFPILSSGYRAELKEM